jgi:hypothetical protein
MKLKQRDNERRTSASATPARAVKKRETPSVSAIFSHHSGRAEAGQTGVFEGLRQAFGHRVDTSLSTAASMVDACYGCVHSRLLPGSSTLVACHHPMTEQAHRHPLAPTIREMGNALPLNVPGMLVLGHPDGINAGRFSWPYRYDPFWLRFCDGFQPEDEAA